MSEDERRAFMRAELRLDEHDGSRRVADVMGGEVQINDRLVAKIIMQPDRTPYVPWAYFGPQHAAEVWRKETASKSTGRTEVRDYYMVPLVNAKHDGYVVIVGEDRVLFNVFPFEASTADGNLRSNGACVYRSYPDAVLCSIDCCTNLLDERRAAGRLRDENTVLKRQLKEERLARKAAEREAERLRGRLYGSEMIGQE